MKVITAQGFSKHQVFETPSFCKHSFLPPAFQRPKVFDGNGGLPTPNLWRFGFQELRWHRRAVSEGREERSCGGRLGGGVGG